MPGKHSELLGDGLSACIINSNEAQWSQTMDGASLSPWGRGRKGSRGLESGRGLQPCSVAWVLRLGQGLLLKVKYKMSPPLAVLT